jgi:hypothetical protein
MSRTHSQIKFFIYEEEAEWQSPWRGEPPTAVLSRQSRASKALETKVSRQSFWCHLNPSQLILCVASAKLVAMVMSVPCLALARSWINVQPDAEMITAYGYSNCQLCKLRWKVLELCLQMMIWVIMHSCILIRLEVLQLLRMNITYAKQLVW